MTLIELLVVLVIIAIFALLVYSYAPKPMDKARALRVQCVNNLKQDGLAFRIWAGDQTTTFPMTRSATNGGTMEFTTGPNAFRHFQILSNELIIPRTVFCPGETDSNRFVAINFVNFNNSNLSYFVGIVSNDNNPTLILAGDHNLTNGIKIRNGLLELTTNNLASWTREIHNKVGNILLADGSVQMVAVSGLQQLIAGTGLATNRIQMPILGP